MLNETDNKCVTPEEKDSAENDVKKKDKIRQSLRDRAPKRAVHIALRTSAIVTVTTNAGSDPEKRIVRLPEVLENDPVGLAIIFGLQDKPDTSLVTAYCRVLDVDKFLAFQADRLVDGVTPVDIVRQWVNELNNSIAQNSVRRKISKISVPLKHAVERSRFMSTLDDDQQFLLGRVVASIPDLHVPPSKPRAGMGELFKDLPDDRLLFDGLRDYAAWAVLELQSHREELLNDQYVEAALVEALHLVEGDIDKLAWRDKKHHPRYLWNPSTLCNAIFEAVCKSHSLTLKERLLLGSTEYRTFLTESENCSPLTREELDAWLERCRKAQRKSGCKPNLAITQRTLSFLQCDLLSLVKPTDGECIGVQWLLASVSVQSSGQQRAQLGNYVIQTDSTYLSYEKRRGTLKRKDTSPIPKKSPIGRAISEFIAIKRNENPDNGRLLENSSYLEEPTTHRPRWRYLLSATFESSVVRSEFLNIHPEGGAFLELLKKLRQHGDEYRKYESRLDALHRQFPAGEKRAQAIKELKGDKSITSSKKSLNCEAIRKTKISLDDVRPGQSPTAREAEERSIAASNSHTVEVFRSLYRNRDNSRYRLKLRAEFAEAVGELMVVLSDKVRELKKSTDVLTPAGVVEAIGIETGIESEDERADRLLAELAVDGYQLNYFGAAVKGNRRIVVETPVTVALLLSAQESHLRKAGNETISDSEVAKAAIEYALIESVIGDMSVRIVDEGRALYDELDLPLYITF